LKIASTAASPAPLKTGRPRTAYQYAVQTLRAEILQGRLAAGEHLRQDDLAKRLEISTTPIREALRSLISEGLVFFDAHRGAVVRGLTLSDVAEIYRLRKVLEPIMVVDAMAAISDAELDNAEALHGRMLQTDDVAQWTELNLEFHAALWASQQHTRLARIVGTLRDSAGPYVSLSLYVSPQHIAASNEEHAQLLKLYRNRDAESAVRQTITHLDATLRTIVQSISANPG
jgi:DNA-binding GntR family transcriptional regulator